jgi:hypothetical protein
MKMSKTKDKVIDGQNEQQAPAVAADMGNGGTAANNPLDELLKKGTVILTAKTREELFAQNEQIKAEAKDVTIGCGAIGRNSDANYTLRIDIIN